MNRRIRPVSLLDSIKTSFMVRRITLLNRRPASNQYYRTDLDFSRQLFKQTVAVLDSQPDAFVGAFKDAFSHRMAYFGGVGVWHLLELSISHNYLYGKGFNF